MWVNVCVLVSARSACVRSACVRSACVRSACVRSACVRSACVRSTCVSVCEECTSACMYYDTVLNHKEEATPPQCWCC